VDLIAVHWLEQTEADVPAKNAWLGAGEVVRLNSMRFAKPRADWRLGRWTAKRALAAYLEVPADPQLLATIELRPAATGAPQVFVAHEPAEVSISLSHREGRAICAIGPCGTKLGCDLEIIEPRGAEFFADYFVAEEQARIAQAPEIERPRLVALMWSAKESALKALHEGLRLDTRSIIVAAAEESFDDNDWSSLHVLCPGEQFFHGWWQHAGVIVRTLVSDPAPAPPIILKIQAYATGDYDAHRGEVIA